MTILEDPRLLLLLPLSLLLAVLTGWLAVLDAQPLRFWARYPWRVFWGGYVATLAFPPPLRPGAVHVGLLLAGCALAVMYVSGVQGLRVSFRRSPVTAVLILAGAFAIGALSSAMRLLRTGEWHRLDLLLLLWFLGVAYWALLAVVADRVARWLGEARVSPPAP